MEIPNKTDADFCVINQILYRGKIIQMNNSGYPGRNLGFDKLGRLNAQIYGYECPRCQKSSGYLFPSSTGFMWFCSESLCMKDDSDESKKIAREAWRKKQELDYYRNNSASERQ